MTVDLTEIWALLAELEKLTPRRATPEAETLRVYADVFRELHHHLSGAAGEIERLRAQAAERDAEIARLTAELSKPVASEWFTIVGGYARYLGGIKIAEVTYSWMACRPPTRFDVGDGGISATGPETGDAGKHAADLALIAAGFRLVGGVHPAGVPDVR